jgi:hypothetical protein
VVSFQEYKGDNTVSFEIMELEKSSGLVKMQQQNRNEEDRRLL